MSEAGWSCEPYGRRYLCLVRLSRTLLAMWFGRLWSQDCGSERMKSDGELRVGTLTVRSLAMRLAEVSSLAARAGVRLLCLQETRTTIFGFMESGMMPFGPKGGIGLWAAGL